MNYLQLAYLTLTSRDLLIYYCFMHVAHALKTSPWISLVAIFGIKV